MTFNKYIIISYVVLIIVIIIGYFYIVDLNKDIAFRDDKILKERQNVHALQDQIKMKADSVQLFAVMVEGLQSEASKKNNEYNVLVSKYNAALDTIRVLKGQSKPPIVTDSSITVPFSGKQGIVKYDGHTIYYIKTKTGEYSIIFVFDPIKLQSEIYYDSKDSLLKNTIKSLTPGVNIDSAVTKIDPQIYTMIYKASADCPELPPVYKPNFFDNFGISVSLSQKLTYIDTQLDFTDTNLDVGLFYKTNNFTLFASKNLLKNEYKFGLSYGLSLRNMINFIF